MGHFARLELVGRITYYLGWIALVCGALFHVGIGRGMFLAVNLTQRNLFEVSVVCFLICIASAARAMNAADSKASGIATRAAAA